MYHPTISYPRLADAADAQGLKLRHSKHQGVYRWILCRADWVDHKTIEVYPHLRDVHKQLTVRGQ